MWRRTNMSLRKGSLVSCRRPMHRACVLRARFFLACSSAAPAPQKNVRAEYQAKMGLVGMDAPRPGNNTAAKIAILVAFLILAGGLSAVLYFALRAADAPPTYAAYKLVDPPSSLAAAGTILLPMMETTEPAVGAAAAANPGVLWWAYTKDATSIGLVPKSGGGWRLVRFDPKGGVNGVPVACSAWAESEPGASAPPVTAGAWKSVGGSLVSPVGGFGEDDLSRLKLEEEPTKVAAVKTPRPLGACTLDSTQPTAAAAAADSTGLATVVTGAVFLLTAPIPDRHSPWIASGAKTPLRPYFATVGTGSGATRHLMWQSEPILRSSDASAVGSYVLMSHAASKGAWVLAVVRSDRTCHEVARAAGPSDTPPDAVAWSGGFGVSQSGTGPVTERAAPGVTCTSSYPLELNWRSADPSVRMLLEPPANAADATGVVVFSPKRDAATGATWYSAAARGSSSFTRIAVTPVITPLEDGVPLWSLIGIAGSDACTALAVGEGVSPEGAVWTTRSTDVPARRNSFPLDLKVSPNAAVLTDEARFVCQWGLAAKNPLASTAIVAQTTPSASNAYPPVLKLSVADLRMRVLLEQVLVGADTGALTRQVVFSPMRDDQGAWWRYAAADRAVAVIPAPLAKEWYLVGINVRNTCAVLAVGRTSGADFSGSDVISWYLGGTHGTGGPIPAALVPSASDVGPTVAVRPSCFVPTTTTAGPTAFGLTLTSPMPIFASRLLTLEPHASGAIIRWASKHGADTCVYVIDLEKEPRFRTGISQLGVVSTVYWGLFLHSRGQAGSGSQYRGLAYSTLKTTDPPPSATPWESAWADDVASSGATSPSPKVAPIPVGLLSTEVGLQVALTGSRISAIFDTAPVVWDAPIRLPVFTETHASGAGGAIKTSHSLSNYDWSTFVTSARVEPDLTLATALYADASTNNYKPELFGSGVRWFFKGETTPARRFPDVYVHQLSPSTLADEPALGRLGAPPSATWVAYSSTVSSGSSTTGAALALLAYTTRRSSVGGIGGTPPVWGLKIWVCLDAGTSTPRAIEFALTARDLRVVV